MNRNVLLILVIVLILCVLTTSESFRPFSRVWGGAKKVGSKAKQGVKFVTLDAPVAIGGAIAGAPGKIAGGLQTASTEGAKASKDYSTAISMKIDNLSDNTRDGYSGRMNVIHKKHDIFKSGVRDNVRGVLENDYEGPILDLGSKVYSPVNTTFNLVDKAGTTGINLIAGGTEKVLTAPFDAVSFAGEKILSPFYGGIKGASKTIIEDPASKVGTAYKNLYSPVAKYTNIAADAIFEPIDDSVTPLLSDADDGVEYIIGGVKSTGRKVKKGTKDKINWFLDLFGGDVSEDSSPVEVGSGGGGGGF